MEKKRTPLYEEHIRLGGKIIDYAGWKLPIQYEGLLVEHNSVRNEAGLFDVSHMGYIEVEGKDAQAFLDYMVTNDISQLEESQIAYSFMCYESGYVVDDLLVYKISREKFFLIVNASNIEKDFEWILKNKASFQVSIENKSDEKAIIALQGPRAEEILQRLTDTDLGHIKFFYLREKLAIDSRVVTLSRTGYTGEDGFEIYVDKQDAARLWRTILEAGEGQIKPAGLGARDTLRFEAGLPLYGNEISENINPLEAGFKYFVKLEKKSDFIGKESLIKQYEQGLTRTIVGIELLDRGIPREGYEVYKDGEKIGHITTGYMSPSLNKSIGNALIDIKHKKMGNELDILIRKKLVKAKIISKNFLREEKKKIIK